ncbi:MAG: DUF255 domain-containing protein [Cyclobacteriaceae bacterium]
MKIVKYIFCLAVLPVLVVMGSWSPVEEEVKINWITWEEAVELTANEANPKKVFVDVYTDWCGWCKVMDKKTFQHPEVAKYMTENFYMVKFNAEQKDSIVYKGVTFKYVPSGKRGYHELAAALLQGKLSYPSTVFLDENMSILTVVPGFNKPPDFYPIAQYFGENEFKNKGWEEYRKSYKLPFEVSE